MSISYNSLSNTSNLNTGQYDITSDTGSSGQVLELNTTTGVLEWSSGSGDGTNLIIPTENLCIPTSVIPSITTGDKNIIFDQTSQTKALTEGFLNIGIGEDSLNGITTGYRNICIGSITGGNATLDSKQNTFVGDAAGDVAGNINQNVAIGASSDVASTATNQIAIGYAAVATEDNSAQIGNSSTNKISLGGTVLLDDSVANSQLWGCNAPSMTGANNILMTDSTTAALTTGTVNTFVGKQAGENTIDKLQTSYFGAYSGRYLNGQQNTGIGYQALEGNSGNIVDNGAKWNTAVGVKAHALCEESTNCVSVGYLAGDTLTGGTKNICVGANADVDSATATGRIVIGASATGITNNTCMIGDSNITAIMPNASATCSLGVTANPFSALWLTNGLTRGQGTLSSGVATINTAAALTGSSIMLTHTTSPSGPIYVSSVSNGVSFSVSDDTGTSSDTFNWVIIN